MTAGTNYTFNISVKPPDGLKSVVSAIISFNGQVNGQTQNFTLWVNNKSCNNPVYSILTAFSTTGNIQFYFDCSNVITKSGNYTLTMRSSVNTGVISGWLDLTYMNNPTSIGYGGTEYTIGQSGTIYVRLLDGNSKPINLGACNATIFFPNKTLWINKQVMTLLDGGYYYDDITIPSIEGLYIVGFDCIIPAQLFRENKTIGFDIGASIPTFTDIFPFDDTDNYTINNAYINYSVTGGGGGAANDYYFNSVKIASGSGITQNINVVLNQSNFINAYEQQYSVVRTALSSTVNWAYLYVNYTTNTPQQTIRGQTELHVSNTPVNVWNYTNRTLTDYNQTWINDKLTNISSDLINTNTTVNYWGNLLSGMITSVNNTLNDWGNSITSLINSIPEMVWNNTNRNLTYYPNVTVELNLTGINVTATVNTTEISESVWNNAVRNLTYYPFPNITVNLTNNITLNTTVVNVTNYTLNLTTEIVNVTNYTLNLTNETYSFNYTYPLTVNLTNYTINVTNETNNYNFSYNYSYNYTNPLNLTVLNQTVEVVNQTLNLTVINQTVNVSNYTLNVTQPIIEVNNYTINLTNYSNNITTYELNLTNYTLNVSQPIIQINNYTNNVTTVNTSDLANDVWNNPSRNLTYYPDMNVTVNLTNNITVIPNITLNTTNYIINLTNYTIDVTNYTLNLTNYTNNITTYLLNLTNYTNNITVINTTVDVTNTTVNPEEIWNYSNRTLTDYNQSDMLNKINDVNNSVTYWGNTINTNLLSINGTLYNKLVGIQGDLSSITGMLIDIQGNLTAMNQSVIDAINNLNLLTAEGVWNYTTRNLTYYPDMNITVIPNITLNTTNYTFNLTNYTIAVTNYTVNLTNYTINVTDYQLNLTNYTNNITVLNTTVNVTNTSVNVSEIAESVWGYNNRTLTDYNQTGIINLLTGIQSDLLTVNNTIGDVNISLSNQITTVYNHINDTLDYITSVNNTLLDVNSTLASQLTQIQNELGNLSFNDTEILNAIANSNNTILSNLYDIQNNLTVMNGTINNIYSQGAETNQYVKDNFTTVINEFGNVYGNLTSIANKIDAHNTTVMNKLYAMQDEISSVNDTVKSGFTNLDTNLQNNFTSLNNTITSWATYFDNFLININSSIASLNSAIGNIPASVWNYTTRTLTADGLINYTQITEDVWNYFNRNLTYYPDMNITINVTNTTVNSTEIAEQVWAWNNRTLTSDGLVNVTDIVEQVWSYNNRTLTDYNLSGIESLILNTNFTLYNKLTDIEISLVTINNTVKDSNATLSLQITDTYNHIDDVLNNLASHNDTLLLINSTIMNKLYSIQDEIASINTTDLVKEVGTNLTNINNSLTTIITNLPLISADDVWAYAVRNLTYYPSTTNATDVWDYFNRTLTYYPTTINATVENVTNVQNVANAQSTFADLKYAGATEYNSGETGHVAYQFLTTIAGQPTPINTGNCNVTIWYPNKTLLVSQTAMTYLTGSSGLYYYSFTVTSTEGVYISNANCINDTTTGYGSSSFHVAPWANEIYTVNTNVLSTNATVNAVETYLNNLILSTNATNTWWFNHTNQTNTAWFEVIDGRLIDLNNTLTGLTIGNISLNVSTTFPPSILKCEPANKNPLNGIFGSNTFDCLLIGT